MNIQARIKAMAGSVTEANEGRTPLLIQIASASSKEEGLLITYLVNIKSSKKSFQEICPIFRLQFNLWVRVKSVADHPKVIAHNSLCPVVY
jgi:hypothetical protein